MEILILILGAMFGLAMGSFFGVVVERSSINKRFTINDLRLTIYGRSRCSKCKHQLEWWENIPLISFLILKGKCRKCRSPIPYWLPLIEIAGGAAGIAVAAQSAATITVINFITVITVIAEILIAAALVAVFFSDWVYGLIPDWAVVCGAFGALITATTDYRLLTTVAAALGAAAFFWFLVKITRGRGMGEGDIGLAFFLGLWLGWPVIAIGLWLAFVIGAIWGIFLIIIGKKKFGQTIPFGPFLIIGAILALQYGKYIIFLLF